MVEWKKLGEVVELDRGVRVVKTDLATEGMIPVFQNSLSPLGYYDIHNYPAGTTFVISAGAAGDIGFSDMPFWAADDCLGVTCPNDTLNKFVFYFLQTKQSILKSQVRKASVPRLSRTVVEKLDFPCIPISLQSRIVGILDTFTASIANLKEQIGERSKQYEHYRDQLLDLEGKEGVEMKTLKEIFETRNGYTPSTKNEEFWMDGIIPWFKMEDIRDNGRILSDSNLHITTKAVKGKGLFKAKSIILATSATIGEHALILVNHLCNQRFTNFYPREEYKDLINIKFYYYYMFIIGEWCKQHTHQGGFASVDMEGLYKLEIPLPPLSEQSRIVSILDQFEASIANLEAQLQEREKQYEHYREKLLTFE